MALHFSPEPRRAQLGVSAHVCSPWYIVTYVGSVSSRPEVHIAIVTSAGTSRTIRARTRRCAKPA